MEKRYYWFKLYADFFESKRIKKLRKMKRGDTLLAIYLKMQLKSLCTGGVLVYSGIEDNFAEELALDLNERPEDVRNTLAFLLEHGLCECDDTNYILPWVAVNTGSETASTQRSRDCRNRKRVAMQQERNADATQVQRIGNVEKEIEKEIDKDNTYSAEFEAFYKEYRRKIDKRKAYNAWKRIPKKDHDELMRGLAAWCAYWDERNEPQYVPYPAVWLNNRRWESEPPKIAKKRNPAQNYSQRPPVSEDDFKKLCINLDEEET